MKRISKFLFIAALLLGLVTNYSCTKDFEEMNTDPNKPGIDQAAPDMLLTNAIESMTDRVHEIFLGHEMGSCWAQHMAKCQYTDEDRYIFRPSVVNNSWRSFYAASGKDIFTIKTITAGLLNAEDSTYQGVALVLQVYVTSVLTDLFGPIPYTEAWLGDEGNTLPKYDDQKSIYMDLISKLSTADNLLNPVTGSLSGDILFNNDVMKWKKFANSLRVRLLMRISGQEETFVTTELTAMLANGNPMFESNDDIAALQYLGSAPNNNPINENRKTRDDHRVSKNFIDLLMGYGDYRIMVFANPDGNDAFEGMPNGLTSADAAAYNGNGIANTSKIGDFFTQATAPGTLMSFSELQFFLAEAALKGYIPGGTAQAKVYYDAGVEASFLQWGDWLQGIFDAHSDDAYGGLSIPAGYTVADEYTWHITDPAAPAYFDEASPTSDLLQLIAEQKYIATFDQGLQSWFEWRRLGFPVLTPAVAGTNDGKIPVRVPYPSDEYATNPSAVAAGVTLLGGGDNLNTRVWWDVTP